MLQTRSSDPGPVRGHAVRPYFRLGRVSLKYGDKTAIENVELDIYPEEMLFLTGPTGAGKSSLLKVLRGEEKQTTGKVTRPGRSVFVASVFQDLRLMEAKSIDENLLLAHDPAMQQGEAFGKEMHELCQAFGIEDQAMKVAHLNGGAKQKIALIRALLTHPQVLLADEPTSSLDQKSAVRVYEILKFYNQKHGLTVVWASHNKELIRKFHGRGIHMEKGRFIYSGQACFT